MQPGQTAFEEAPGGHLVPAVIVGIADDETGEYEEEVDGEEPVVDDLVNGAVGIGLKEMEDNDHHRGYAAQAVQDLIAGF